MNYWFFMLFSTLLIPLVMLIFGYIFKNNPPKKINRLYGYRTAMSMKNKETWQFAHQHSRKIWLRVGFILLPITLVAMALVLGKDDDAISNVALIICMIQLAALIGSIVPTERALKKKFDSEGKPK
ncbi:SdpI family protein [Facklamia sp. 7083-14-GEN3]|uniref:SdpI family protein n=1 Tax=Facklamia sp. 7083-14-GEN3 TaxID=2973478 RepID=UPI00215CD065|nr:SdpI family protein [Facklamia sp. 7083-14-GEN3]MCR8969063.1 SdpI family protein [Facklamia sp. 7083-14-GEN3]